MEEIWKEIIGYENLYVVSNLGNVKSLSKRNKNDGCLVKPRTQPNGYIHVCLSKNGTTKIKTIHRLVATAFIPHNEKENEVNHINGIKSDNRVENLEWVTHKENMLHAIKMGVLFDIRKVKPKNLKMIRVAKKKNNKIIKVFDSLSQAANEEKVYSRAIKWRAEHNSIINGYEWCFVN